MTAVRLHAFFSTGLGSDQEIGPWTAFEWNDSGDDTDLVDWAEAFRVGQLDVSIDDGVFSWEQTANGSDTGSFELVAGRIVRLWKPSGSLGQPVSVEFFDGVPDGRWFSDEFGRPFDVADLQAP
jgi:hypothetical protein